jgi:hypothetical protein
LRNPPDPERRNPATATNRPWWLHQPASGVRRIACTELCDVGRESDGRHGIVWNVSVLGVYVAIDTPIPTLSEILRLSFTLPADPARIVCHARVAWRNLPSAFKGCGASAAGLPPGCGFAFVDLSAADHARIETRVAASRRA